MKQYKKDSVHIIAPEGKITLGRGGEELREVAKAAVEAGERKLLLNFSEVSFMDSTGIGILVSVHTTLKNNEGQLALCGVGNRIMDLFRITRLVDIFLLFETEEEAVSKM